jgi:hypothetical protein
LWRETGNQFQNTLDKKLWNKSDILLPTTCLNITCDNRPTYLGRALKGIVTQTFVRLFMMEEEGFPLCMSRLHVTIALFHILLQDIAVAFVLLLLFVI